MTEAELADTIERNLERFGSVSVGPDEWVVILNALRRHTPPLTEGTMLKRLSLALYNKAASLGLDVDPEGGGDLTPSTVLVMAVLEEMREPSEAMIDAGCECDAYDQAVWSNRKRYEDLKAKRPEIPERTTHGAAPIQVLPIVWQAMLDAIKESK